MNLDTKEPLKNLSAVVFGNALQDYQHRNLMLKFEGYRWWVVPVASI